MKTKQTRKKAIRFALFSIRRIYEAVREGRFSPYYGKKLAERYWKKLNLSEKEIFRYFGHLSEAEIRDQNKKSPTLHWLMEGRSGECLYALKYFGFIGRTGATHSKQKVRSM
ncbi:MAG: hypothetical protein V5A59_00490 [Bacteroidales bacterium]|nr:hypothetical protein [Bacteroidales bacterium]